MDGVRGVLSSRVTTLPGATGWLKTRVAPGAGLPALSYQYSSMRRPAIDCEELFFSLKVVTTSLPTTLVEGAVIATSAVPLSWAETVPARARELTSAAVRIPREFKFMESLRLFWGGDRRQYPRGF